MDWVKPLNQYLSQIDRENNAKIIYSLLKVYNWSDNAIYGTLGNLERESTLNPNIYQYFNMTNEAYGYGLPQWSPRTKWEKYCIEHNVDIDDGNAQVKAINDNSIGDWQTSNTGVKYEDFKKSTESVEYLTNVFKKSFEKNNLDDLQIRVEYALKWQNFFNENPIKPLEPAVKSSSYKIKIYFFGRRRKNVIKKRRIVN